MSNTTLIGQEKFYVNEGRLFRCNSLTDEAICDLEWAQRVLKQPDIVFQNGKHSHHIANELLEKAEDFLIDYRVFVAA